jgi:hypothetical protein
VRISFFARLFGRRESNEAVKGRTRPELDPYVQQLIAISRKYAGTGGSAGFGVGGKEETIKIGEEINRKYGLAGMRYICEQIAREHLYPGAGRELESVWDGIGHWQG